MVHIIALAPKDDHRTSAPQIIYADFVYQNNERCEPWIYRHRRGTAERYSTTEEIEEIVSDYIKNPETK